MTQEECQLQIDKRMPIVCPRCGGKIEPLITVDSSETPSFWQGCGACNIFTAGVFPKVYETAVKMVDTKHFIAYPHIHEPNKEEDPIAFEYWYKCQIHGTTTVVLNVLSLHGVI